MMMHNVMQALALVPVTIFLTASFFVLFAARKADTQGLKSFGYLVTGLLWLCAALVFFTSIYGSLVRRNDMMSMRRGMMIQEKQTPAPMPNAPMSRQAK
ncbi:MAG: hypothetical protein WC417_01820 [Candidatus Omnitrophota bacterium]|jgi:hypothetical protein